jgi:Flp pilus assembly protein TadD
LNLVGVSQHKLTLQGLCKRLWWWGVGVRLAFVILGCAPAPQHEASESERVAQMRSQARAASERGDTGEAVRVLLQATELVPGDPEVWNDLGLAQQAHGDWQAAVTAYEASIRIDPNLYEPHLNLAVLLMQRGISGRARSEFDEATQADPANALVYWNYATALVEVGKPEQARELLVRALELDPELGPAQAAMGRVEALAGRQ